MKYTILVCVVFFATVFGNVKMKRILVTGANKGIGFAIVKKLLADFENTYIFLGARDVLKGSQAVATLESENPNWKDRVRAIELDCSAQESVTKASNIIKEICGSELHPLYGIINNAGIGFGYDMQATMATNLYGVKRVTESFLPLLSPTEGRIVNVSSGSGTATLFLIKNYFDSEATCLMCLTAPMFVTKCSPERKSFFVNSQVTFDEIDNLIKECLLLEPSGEAAFEAKGLGSGQAYGLSKACLNLYTMLVSRENPNLIGTHNYIATLNICPLNSIWYFVQCLHSECLFTWVYRH